LKALNTTYLFAIKLLIVSLVILYLAYKIYTNDVFDTLPKYSNYKLNFIGLVFSLSILNWGLEAKKWQILVSSIRRFSFFESYKSVLAGLSVGIFTPNRIGNFIGRLAWIDKANRQQATINTMIGNLAQFIVTVVLGIVGFVLVVFYKFNIEHEWFIFLFALLFMVTSTVLYFKPSLILKTFLKRFLPKKSQQHIIHIEGKPKSFKLYILGLSLLRYLTFLTQYKLLFSAFNMHIYWGLMFGLISTVYLLTTIIPSVFFGKLFVRESVAVFVFSLVDIEIALILLVAFLLWLINLAIPASIGGIIWLKKSKQ